MGVINQLDTQTSNMIAAGEESGNLEESFAQMEVWFDKAKKTQSAIGKAMVYPCVLLFVMIIVLIVRPSGLMGKVTEDKA